jgi:hypothetical protein
MFGYTGKDIDLSCTVKAPYRRVATSRKHRNGVRPLNEDILYESCGIWQGNRVLFVRQLLGNGSSSTSLEAFVCQ